MQSAAIAEIIERAEQLLWVIARCDVENLGGHRSTALRQLHCLELRAGDMKIPDLYDEVLRWRATHGST
ncbi:MAG TPA: hypothetical protein VGH38_22110 [Bryobacteraceae bacterium]